MKWTILTASVLCLSGCIISTNKDVIEYRQETLASVGVPPMVYTYPNNLLDVTTTTIDYY